MEEYRGKHLESALIGRRVATDGKILWGTPGACIGLCVATETAEGFTTLVGML